MRKSFIGTFVIMVALSFVGCSLGDAKLSRRERERAVSALDQLYAEYLTGTLTDARTNLQKAIAFMHESCSRYPELQGALSIGYARLSLLEREAGNEAQSRLLFEKSRYWRMSDREKAGSKAEEILTDHDAFSRDDSDKMVLDWDKKWSKGEGPAYLKGLR